MKAYRPRDARSPPRLTDSLVNSSYIKVSIRYSYPIGLTGPFGRGTRTRTLNDGIKIRSVAITPYLNCLEREKGIEPSTLAWKAKVIPFYDSRITLGANGQNRTGTPLWNQILSLTCLPISPHSHYYWCPNRDSNSDAEATASKTAVSTNSTIGALSICYF